MQIGFVNIVSFGFYKYLVVVWNWNRNVVNDDIFFMEYNCFYGMYFWVRLNEEIYWGLLIIMRLLQDLFLVLYKV